MNSKSSSEIVDNLLEDVTLTPVAHDSDYEALVESLTGIGQYLENLFTIVPHSDLEQREIIEYLWFTLQELALLNGLAITSDKIDIDV